MVEGDVHNDNNDDDDGGKSKSKNVLLQDRGSPARSTNETVHITVMDNDDLPPKFTLDVYKTQIPEFYPLLVSKTDVHLMNADLIISDSNPE